MVDFILDENLDIVFSETCCELDFTYESLMLSTLFTDARVNEQRGYWAETQSSELWLYKQARKNEDTYNNIAEAALTALQQLVNLGIYAAVNIESVQSNSINIRIIEKNTRKVKRKSIKI